MENETQIKNYIDTKEKNTLSWTLTTIENNYNNLLQKETKETGDWLKLFQWLKNDKALLKYAEYKAKENELKRWEKVKMELLELRLSITCPYFKDFQEFLDELNQWEYVPQPWDDWNNWNEGWNENVEIRQSNTFCGATIDNILSSPYYRNSQTWVTWCSKTARENWKRFGIVLPSWNAYDAWERPWQDCLWTLPADKVNDKPKKRWKAIEPSDFIAWSKWNYADIYVESKSDYGHRAAAFKDDSWQWYVLDPYTRVNWRLDTKPKKLEDYVKVKKIVKAHFYESKGYVPEDSEVATEPQVEKAVQRAISIAEDNCHGYERWGKGQNWQYDCSGLVTNAFKKAWFDVPISWTATMRKNFTKVWFEWISPYDPNNLKRWDILLKDIWADGQRHTEIYTWNWKFVWARSNYDKASWDSSWKEISETSANRLTNFGRNWVLRYKW